VGLAASVPQPANTCSVPRNPSALPFGRAAGGNPPTALAPYSSASSASSTTAVNNAGVKPIEGAPTRTTKHGTSQSSSSSPGSLFFRTVDLGATAVASLEPGPQAAAQPASHRGRPTSPSGTSPCQVSSSKAASFLPPRPG
jgi:hypothetical protein